MSWLSALKLIGKGALAVGTGGASLGFPVVGAPSMIGDAVDTFGHKQPNPNGSILDAAGNFSSGMEAGRAKGRLDEAGVNQSQDRLALDRATLAQRAPGVRAGNAVRGDILANAQDFAYGAPTMVGNIPVPSSTGGLRPSIFSPATRALGTKMSGDALSASNTGSDIPSLTPLPQSGPLDSILNTASTISSVGGLFSRIPRAIRRPMDEQPYATNQADTEANQWG